MGTTTFSGPIKAGSIKDTSGNTVGSDVANTGFALMAQSAVIDIIGATNTATVGTIPANSQIVDVILNVTTVANDSGTATVQVGHSGDTDGTDIGTTDQQVTATYTGANGNGTTGAATVTVLYIQNNNLA